MQSIEHNVFNDRFAINVCYEINNLNAFSAFNALNP